MLSPQQKADLFSLNNQYPDYNSWNTYYGTNPDRWRTDRYSSIERILGPEKYVKFKNQYYKGQNPVAVYNRNKNNYKKYQNQKYKTIKSKKAYHNSSAKYKATKSKGNNGKAKGKK